MAEQCKHCNCIMGVEEHSEGCKTLEQATQEMIKSMYSTGWECLKCTRVYSPTTHCCDHCNKKVID